MQLLFVTSTMVFGYSTIRLIVCIYRYSAAGPDLADAISKVGCHFGAKEKVRGQQKCLSCMGIFYVNQKNLNVISRHNWGAIQWFAQASLRIATVATRLPRL